MPRVTLAHPHTDAATDAARFRVADPMDPRFLGEGPCRGLHQRQLESWDDIQPFEKLGGNPHARYTDCNRCRLRVRYWPKAHATSHTMNNISPHAVRAILAALYDKGVWEEMTWQDFMRETQLYEAKLKADGQLVTDAVKRERKQAADDAKAEKAAEKAAAKAKAVPKAAATPAPEARPSADFATMFRNAVNQMEAAAVPGAAASSQQGRPTATTTAPTAHGHHQGPGPFAGQTSSSMEVSPMAAMAPAPAPAPTPRRLEATLAAQVAQTSNDEVRAEALAAIAKVTQRARVEIQQVDSRRAAAEEIAIRTSEEAQQLRAQVLALQQQLLGQPSAAEVARPSAAEISALAVHSGSTIQSFEWTETNEDHDHNKMPTTISMSPAVATTCSLLPPTPVTPHWAESSEHLQLAGFL